MTEGRGYQFTWCDGAFCLISMLLSFIGILSDGWLVYTYARNELWVYFSITLFLALVPPVVINAFSISWHIEDNSASIWKWFFSIVLFGTIQRNWAIFRAGCKAQKTKDQKDFRVLYRHKRDLCVLDLYKSFLKSAPQLVLQLYIMLDTQDWRVPTCTHFLVTTFFAMVVTQLMVKKKVAADAPFWQKLAHGIAMGAGFTFCFINIGDSLSNNVALAGLILMYTYAGEENLESILTYHREWTNGGYHLHGKIAMAAVGVSFLIDVIVVTQYALGKLWVYAGMTLFFVLMPSVVVNICSLRWHIHDQRVSKIIWVASVLQFGVLHRYWLCLRAGLKADRTRDADDFRELYQHQSDLCMLRLFDSFLESAPQLVLQLYIMVNQEDWNPWTGVSALLSLLSLGWGIAAYGKAMRLHRAEKQQLSWTGLVLQTLWRFGTMTSRVTAMVLLACVCGAWTLAILGAHWALMTSWLVWQKTDFCPSRCEELAYNAVVGAIYTFCFFNVREGRSRGRVVSFYALIGVQNVAFLVAYCIAWGDADDLHAITATAVVLGSFGIASRSTAKKCCL
ncbi:hypothetical protein V5799_031809 [Amblyomma americanum]|uniref:XK-related protein n=1 Tax=Amblyomma americanum TaxID=6943 RepID=A0AAQ4DSZ1_AMBAM